jgi:hypothetical protein
MKYANKKTALAAILSLMTLSACAAGAPVVGLWAKYPVSDQNMKAVARPQYVFTNVKLTDPTMFTGLNLVGAETAVICCVVVKNLTPLNLANVVKKYASDSEFVEHMKSVKGLNFMYEADPAEKAVQNDYFKTVMHANLDPQDLTSFYAAVVGARLSEKLTVKNPFKVGADQVSLKVTYPKSKTSVQYEFRVNDTSVKFSHASTSAE